MTDISQDPTTEKTTYVSLYRKWRPSRFSEVVGQDHVVRALANAVQLGRISHAYLFCGPRGTGKTSVARILAKSVNCEIGPTPEPDNSCRHCQAINRGNSFDVFEIDGASNRGIDDARELRENSRFAPSESRKKFYIIDEVHMLTTEAFNALLKTLEEPPEHLVFILATTEAHKVPATIVSRCQRYDFRRIDTATISRRLELIAEAEGIEISGPSLQLIAQDAGGSLRDAIGSLEQIAFAFDGPIEQEQARNLLGHSDSEAVARVIDILVRGEADQVFDFSEAFFCDGGDFSQLVKDLIEYVRGILVSIHTGSSDLALAGSQDPTKLNEYARSLDLTGVYSFLDALADIQIRIRQGADERTWFELGLLRVLGARPIGNLRAIAGHESSGLSERQSKAEERLANPATTPSFSKTTVPANPVSANGSVEGANNAAASDPDADPDIAVKLWPRIIEEVKKDKISTYALLLECHPRSGARGLELRFHAGADFHRSELEKPAHLEVLQRVILNVTGTTIDIVCSESEELGPARKSAETHKPDDKQDLIQLAKDNFQAMIVDEQATQELPRE